MTKYKLIVVVDNELKMPKGKLARQVAGAVTHVIMYHLCYFKWFPMIDWYKKGLKTVVLKTNDLYKVRADLGLYNIDYLPMVDAGKTVFKQPTLTCLGLTLIKEDKVPDFINELSLL